MMFTAGIRKIIHLVQKIGIITPSEDPGLDTEAAPEQAPPQYRNLDWAKIICVFALASAIDIALVSVQLDSQLPVVFYFLELAILLSFTCFFTSNAVHTNCPLVAQVLERLGIFFGVIAFFISISISFPAVWFKCITFFIYTISWVAIFFCNSYV